ncbi:MAG: hypothetical protein IJJ71_00890 [Treponema sp.]|uniref:hypothetical protein n=1 Tax=Treponema sp. TaxID=166 RepID=UPI0025F29B7D|nr:hypothetical protein [Treponema sp.]MBR0494715.1 hypothetical protein [Treponema sp.]
MNKKSVAFKLLVSFVCSIVSIALFSCGEESGLGASIDTKSPTLTISYPDAGVAVRDSFILAGDCSDDKFISKVMVSVKNLESGVGYGNYLAKVSATQTSWQVTLNEYDPNNPEYYNGWQLPDGKYEVSVTAYDNAGNNSGVSSRQFEIDNTPPVFIISNPGVVKSSNLSASAYGSLFTIEGTISDNHPISLMDVKIYSKDGNLVSSETYEGSEIDFYREEDIATAGGSSVTIAQFSDTATATAKNRYSQLHPSESGTEYYYAQISLYDSAKIFKNPPVGSSRSAVELASDAYGNSTSTVYLYDDVYTSLMSAKKGLGLSAANLKDILSGIDKSENAEAALSKLTSSAKNTESEQNHLYFSLNPMANPTYNVNGFDFFKDNQLASAGNAVSVTISSGLDGTNIAPEIVKVWVKKCSDKPSDKTALKSELEKLNQKVIDLEKQENEFVENSTRISLSDTDEWLLVYDYSKHFDKGSSLTTKTFSVTMPSIKDFYDETENYIQLNKFYVFGVTGYDIEDVRFSHDTIYGFEGNAAGVPPTIVFDEKPEILSIWKDFSSPIFSGTANVVTGGGYVTELTAKLVVKDESNSNEIGTFSDTLIHKDVNGELTWISSAAAALSWDEENAKWKLDPSKLPGLAEKFNSLALAGIHWLASFEISGKSSSGHSAAVSRDIHIDTIKPTVTLSSITPNVSGADYFGNDSNTYLNGKITVKGNVEEQNLSDDDDSVCYDIWASTNLNATLTAGDSILQGLIEKSSELGLSAYGDGNFDGKIGKQFSLSIPFDTRAITKYFHVFKNAASDAKIQIELVITAKDKAGNTGSCSSKTLLTGDKNFVIYQETDRPKISLGNANPDAATNLFGTTSNNKLQISFEDDDSVKLVFVTMYDKDGNELPASKTSYPANPYIDSPGKTTFSLNYVLPKDEDVYKVRIDAYDENLTQTTLIDSNTVWQKTIPAFFVTVDSGAPTLSVDSIQKYLKTSDKITGTVSPAVKNFDNGTTISSKFLDSDLKELSPQPVVLSSVTNGSNWEIALGNLPGDVSKNYILEISATDKYSQKNSTNIRFMIDPIPPVIDGTKFVEKTVFLDVSKYVTLEANVSDGTDGSGIASFGYYVSSSNLAPASYDSVQWTPLNQADDCWRVSFDISAIKNEDAVLYAFLAAKDNAGNTVIYNNSAKITVDKQAPSISVKKFGDDSAEVSERGSNSTNNPSASFNVVVTDTNADSLSATSGTGVSVGTASAIDGGKKYPVSVTWTGTAGNIEDSKEVKFTAKDSNNRTSEKSVVLKCDDYAPRITVDSYSSTFRATSFSLTGTIKDANFTDGIEVWLVPVDSEKPLVAATAVTSSDVSKTGGTWRAVFSGADDISYNIAIIAEDSLGNKALYSTTPSATTAKTGTDVSKVKTVGNGSFLVDSVAPSLKASSVKIGKTADSAVVMEQFYANGKSNIYIEGIATDVGSGVDKVYIGVAGKVSDTNKIETTLSDTGTSGEKKFSATIDKSKITKTGTVYAKLVDKAGNSADINLVAITFDNTDPEIQSYEFKDTTTGLKTPYKAYKSADNTYFIHNGDSHKFTLNGIATDNLGIETVVLTVKQGTTEISGIPENTGNTSEWKFEDIDLSALSASGTATITVTDKAGNSKTQDIAIKLDNKIPVGSHVFDSNGKDKFFRVGEANGGVGGKYESGTWGSDTTLRIRGYFDDDNGSGISMIYYKITQEEPDEGSIKTFLAEYSNSANFTSYFAPCAEKFADVDVNGSTESVKSNFDEKVSGFKKGKNYLVLVAVDNVGNSAVDTLTYSEDNIKKYYSLNVDTDAPTASHTKVDGKTEVSTKLVNAESDIVVEGTASDVVENLVTSGVKKVELKVSGKGKKQDNSEVTVSWKTDASYTPTSSGALDGTWTATIDKDIFASVYTGNFSVQAVVTDNAGDSGNSATVNLFTISVDKKPPEIKLSSPNDADKTTTVIEVNKKINLSGTAKDGTSLPSDAILAFQYALKSAANLSDENDTGWTSLTNAANGHAGMDDFEISGDYTFEIKNLDTEAEGFSDEKEYYFRVKAKDAAGNIGYSNKVEVKVSQDTDRPVIKFENLTDLATEAVPNPSPRFVLKYGTKSIVIASVSDDDGIVGVNDVIISETPYSGSGTLPSTSSYSPTNGTVTFTPQADNAAGKNVDGEKTCYIYVKDAKETKFYTTYKTDHTDDTKWILSTPKIKVNDASLGSDAVSKKFSYQSDSTPPTVGEIKALAYKANGTTPNGGAKKTDDGTADVLDSNGNKIYDQFEAITASYILGGTEKQQVKFQIAAEDASGIEGIALEISYKTKAGAEQVLKLCSSNFADMAAQNYTVSGSLAPKTVAAGNPAAVWTTGNLDFIKNAKTGSVTLKVMPYDKLGLIGSGNVTFMADNDGPEILVNNPLPTEQKTGIIEVNGTAIDSSGAGTTAISYLVPTTAQKNSTDVTLAALTDWKGTLDSKSTETIWKFVFNGTDNENLIVYDKPESYAVEFSNNLYTIPLFLKAVDALGNYTIKRDYSIKHNPEGDRPVTTLSYPTEANYRSEAEKYAVLGGTIGVTGSVTIPSGTTSPAAVYLQIADANGNFSASDKAKAKDTYLFTVLDSSSVTGINWETSKYSDAEKAAWWGIKATLTSGTWRIDLNGNKKMDPSGNGTNNICIRACGVNAEGKLGSWSEAYNVRIDNKAPTATVAVEKWTNNGTELAIPNPTGKTKSATMEYTAGMYLKDNWYLVLNILDESGLYDEKGNSEHNYKFTVMEGDRELIRNTHYYMEASNNGKTGTEKTEGFKVYIPIAKQNPSYLYTISAYDKDTGNSHQFVGTYSFKIDNEAPTLGEVLVNGNPLSASTKIKESEYVLTLKNSTRESGSGFNQAVYYFMRKGNDVATTGYSSAGYTTVSKKATLIDPVIPYSDSDPAITSENYDNLSKSKVQMSTLTPVPIKQGSETYYLYGKTIAGSQTDATSFTATTATDITGNRHIRKGGLIYIDGTFHLITSLDAGKVTFKSNTDGTQTSAVLIYAQVVDNTYDETVTDRIANGGTGFAIDNDDGDGLPEKISQVSNDYTWSSTIHSTNMPDGPVSVVVLQFDMAGNVSGTTIDCTIANNAPRVAKLYLATDLNNNSNFEDDEFETYSIIDAETEAKDIYTLDFSAKDSKGKLKYPAGVFTAKDKLAVVPEIVGGNKSIKLVAKKDADSTAAVTGSEANLLAAIAGKTATGTEKTGLTAAAGTQKYHITASNFSAAEASNKFYAFVLENSVLSGLSDFDSNAETEDGRAKNEDKDGANKNFSFTFWDETDETTQGNNSQKAVVLVKGFSFDLTDGTSPKVVVNPFYWQNLNSNSVYGSSSAEKIGDLKGHIELEKDLPDSFTTVKTGVNDRDPKVSGKITFSGTAYDEHSLASLKFTFSNGSVTPFPDVTIATYDKANSVWKLYGTGGTKSVSTAGYEASISVVSTNAKGEKVDTYGVFDDKVYFGQKGHKIYWTLSIDTEKLGTVAAATNMSLTVLATDLAGNVTSTESAKISKPETTPDYIPGSELSAENKYTVTDGTTNWPVYRMDVVPYVSKVYTKLAKNKNSNWSVYNRTALGHYPVQSVVSNVDETIALNTKTSEDVILYGFNINHSSAKIVSGDKTFTVNNATNALKIDNGTAGQLKFNVASLSSGILNLTVSDLPIMNNINNNAAKGCASENGTAYKNCYNHQSNGDTNNIQTDDIEFDVWEFNDRAAVPINGLATGINMEVNQKTGMLNYAFANGGLYYSMGGKVSDTNYSSYYWAADWDTFAGPCVGFHVDELGYTYSVVSGGDTNNSGSVDKWDLYTSRWGIGPHNSGGTLNDSSNTSGSFNALRLEEIALKTGSDKFAYSLMKYRFLSPEFASTVSGTNTNLYLVYYDALTNQIRFRAGTFSGDSKEQPAGFNDEYQGGNSSYYKTNNCQIIATGSDGGTFTVAGGTKSVSAISGRGAGQYVDVAVVKNNAGKDVVCVVWYDADANSCKFSYTTDPIGNWNSHKGNETAANWSAPVTVFDEGGEYCHIVSDKNNHLHIAAYAGNGDVMYAYLDDYTSTASTCTVDASGTVGEHLTLDVAVNSKGHSIPYIGYYTSAIKKPKYAYLVDNTTAATDQFNYAPAGVDSDERFTGAWEVAVVPTPSRMTTNREDKVNIGLWKSSGVLTDSKINGAVINSSRKNTLSGYDSTNWSKTYGNGTSNGVLGYQISSSSGSCLETAQMR